MGSYFREEGEGKVKVKGAGVEDQSMLFVHFVRNSFSHPLGLGVQELVKCTFNLKFTND